ncbi:MAG: alpha/beta hydrolase [Pseudomonadales bacterium]|nr:alpha/beta hydrolase [Pseudomonadales bacterium]
MINSQTVTVSGMNFEVSVAGDENNPMVLFLHGFPQTNYTWRHQLKYLAAAGFYCIAPNQRGYSQGARPVGVDQYATSALLADMLGLIAEMSPHNNIQDDNGKPMAQAHIVGHDWGGQLSWLLAARYPDQVRSLTVLSRPHPAAFGAAMQQDKQQSGRSKHHRAFQDKDSATLLLAEDAKRLRKMFAEQWVEPVDINAYLTVLGDHDALDAAINWYRCRVDGTALVGDNVPEITVPTLYLWGSEDATVGRMAAENTKNFVTADFTFIEIPEVGHFITDQVTAIVNENLLAHIKSVEVSINRLRP